MAGLPFAPTAEAAGMQVDVVSFRAAYGPETWKDERGSLGDGLSLVNTPLPAEELPGPFAVYSNPYANTTTRHPAAGPLNYWGYALTVDVDLKGPSGQNVTTGDYLIEARIPTGAGTIPAKLAKTGVASFRAVFDLDGENGRGDFPPLPAGDHTVVFDVYRYASSDPTISPQRIATLTHAFEAANAFLDQGGFELPESVIPQYTDVGATESAEFHPVMVAPDADFDVGVTFTGMNGAITGREAEVVLVNDRTATVVATESTDARGRLETTTQPGGAMGASTSALLLLAAHLTGENNTVGSAVLVLPVSANGVEIAEVQPEARALGGRSVPQLSTVAVTVYDVNATPDSASRAGTLYALRGNEVVATAQIPPTEFSPAKSNRTVRLQAGALQGSGEAAQYSLFAFLQGNDGKFYGFATANRGIGLLVDGDRVAPGERGTLRVTVRNLNDNLNGRDDVGLSQTVSVTVTGLPGGVPYETEITVDERGEGLVEVPYAANTEGSFFAVVNATAGELETGRSYELTVTRAANAFDRVIERVTPGPGALPLLLAALGLALAWRRRD